MRRPYDMPRFAIAFTALLLALFAFELSPPGQALVRPWTGGVASTASAIIRGFDGDAIAHGKTLASQQSGFAITIEAGCNGVEAMLVLAAGILAFPAAWRLRAVGFLAGVAAIQALNLVRIVSLFYLGQWDRDWFEWAHLYLWQVLIMLDVLVVWLLWIRAAQRQAGAVATAEA
jgi:exosortase H (IPTLxxWG-CTERM-specific)